jgi:hypothetical protein
MGRDVSDLSDDDIRKMVAERERRFLEEAPTSAAQAATIILDGVKADRWRILVGDDAHRLDDLVRRSPDRAYDVDFFERFAREAGWRIGPRFREGTGTSGAYGFSLKAAFPMPRSTVSKQSPRLNHRIALGAQ